MSYKVTIKVERNNHFVDSSFRIDEHEIYTKDWAQSIDELIDEFKEVYSNDVIEF
jgi:hypothetical protein